MVSIYLGFWVQKLEVVHVHVRDCDYYIYICLVSINRYVLTLFKLCKYITYCNIREGTLVSGNRS